MELNQDPQFNFFQLLGYSKVETFTRVRCDDNVNQFVQIFQKFVKTSCFNVASLNSMINTNALFSSHNYDEICKLPSSYTIMFQVA
jgi:hypothetical protein